VDGEGLDTQAGWRWDDNETAKYYEPSGSDEEGDEGSGDGGWLDVVQTVLDVAGVVPVIGEPADAVNAAIYLAQGDYGNAALSGAAMVPVLGNLATGGKVVKRVVKASAVSDDTADIAKAVDGETRWTSIGRRAHAEAVYDDGFQTEFRLPSGKRMDAYNPDTKEIVELKPANDRAIRRGQRQVQSYCDECDRVFGPGHRGRVETYDPNEFLP
jgi:hypothetical protein